MQLVKRKTPGILAWLFRSRREDLAGRRAELKQKLALARAHHRPTRDILAELRDVTHQQLGMGRGW